MIRDRTGGPGCTFTPCSRGGSGAANTRRGPCCRRKQNWRTNSAAGPAPPRGRSGHFTATGWPGRSSEEGTCRPGRMLIQASHDGPSRLCPDAASAPPPSASPARPPYMRVGRDHGAALVRAGASAPRAGARLATWRSCRRFPFCPPSGARGASAAGTSGRRARASPGLLARARPPVPVLAAYGRNLPRVREGARWQSGMPSRHLGCQRASRSLSAILARTSRTTLIASRSEPVSSMPGSSA